MFTDKIKAYLELNHKNRKPAEYTLQGLSLPFNGYINGVALVPDTVVDRELFPIEMVYTGVMRRSINGLDNYSVVLDGIQDGMAPDLVIGFTDMFNVFNIDMITALFIGVYNLLTTDVAEDRHFIANIREDLIDSLGIERFGRIIPKDLLTAVTSLVYDAIDVRGEQKKCLKFTRTTEEAKHWRHVRPRPMVIGAD